MKETVKGLYEELKGTRVIKGELAVNGFSEEDYTELYLVLLEELRPFFNGDYYRWYGDWVRKYYRYKQATNRRYDFYCPQMEHSVDQHTVREQLAVIKYFLYRRATSKYDTKEEY